MVSAKTTVSATAVRRLAIAAQGYGGRYRRATCRRRREPTVRRLSCVQLDSISTVERSAPDHARRPCRRLPAGRGLDGCSAPAGSSSTGRTRRA